MTAPIIPDGEADELLALGSAFQAATQDVTMLRRLAASIAQATDHAETSVATLKDMMWTAMVKRPRIDGHVVATANGLLAAGLTMPVSRGITQSQLERVAAIFNERPKGRRPAPSTKAVTQRVSLAWQPDNAWGNLPREIPGYDLSTMEASSREAGLLAMLDAGLPPFCDLEKFDSPMDLAAFNAATTNSARANECWALINKWLRVHNVEGSSDEGVRIRREKSWVFLFSIKISLMKA